MGINVQYVDVTAKEFWELHIIHCIGYTKVIMINLNMEFAYVETIIECMI